jgi:hypothetical protein
MMLPNGELIFMTLEPRSLIMEIFLSKISSLVNLFFSFGVSFISFSNFLSL